MLRNLVTNKRSVGSDRRGSRTLVASVPSGRLLRSGSVGIDRMDSAQVSSGKPPTDGERRAVEDGLWAEFRRNPSVENRNAILIYHWGLIHRVALRFNSTVNASGRYTFGEILSEASITAIKCIDRFDGKQGNRFSTYYWTSFFRNAIRDLVREGRNANRPAKEKPVSLGGSGEWVADKSFRRPDTIEEETGESIESLLSVLDQKKRAVIVGRFIQEKTLQDLADELGLTKERIRQIESQALRLIQAKLGIGKDGSPE